MNVHKDADYGISPKWPTASQQKQFLEITSHTTIRKGEPTSINFYIEM